MKKVIFKDDSVECKCGFIGNIFTIQKHFKKSWTYTNGKIEKNDHTKKQ
jgi:hypothetical protein